MSQEPKGPDRKAPGDRTPDQLDRVIDDAFDHSSIADGLNGLNEGFADGVKDAKEPIDDDYIVRTIVEEGEEVGGEPPPRFDEDDNPFDGTRIDPKSFEATATIAIERMREELRKTIEECGEALLDGDIDRASQLVRDLTNRMESAGKSALPEDMRTMYEDVRENLEAAIKEKDPAAKSRLYKFACGAMDFIPVAGPAKMIVEAAMGKTMGGDTLDGWKRFLHMTEGVVFTMVDLTGFGVVATKLGKAGKLGTHLAPRLLMRSAALMRALGMSRSIYSPLFRSGRTLMKYPGLAYAASRGLENIIKVRKSRRLLLSKDFLRTPPSNEEDVIGDPSKRPGARLDEDVYGEDDEFAQAA